MVLGEHTVLDADAIARVVRRLALEIVERTGGGEGLALVGVRRGGEPIARWLAREMANTEAAQVPVGSLDIGLYRDDASLPDPKGPSEMSFGIDDKQVVLVDDVLHTGRTVRAAIDCLLDYGRPRRVWLAVLCDRGGRELPIAADFVGRVLEVPEDFVLDVRAEGSAGDQAVLRSQPGRRGGGR